MATFSWAVNRLRVFLGMGEPPLEIVAYSSGPFFPFRLKQDTDRCGGTDVGACPGRPRGASRALYGGRPVAISDGSRAAEPNSGVESAQDHEEGPIAAATAGSPCRPGAALPGIAVILALLRTVVYFKDFPTSQNAVLRRGVGAARPRRWYPRRRAFPEAA